VRPRFSVGSPSLGEKPAGVTAAALFSSPRPWGEEAPALPAAIITADRAEHHARRFLPAIAARFGVQPGGFDQGVRPLISVLTDLTAPGAGTRLPFTMCCRPTPGQLRFLICIHAHAFRPWGEPGRQSAIREGETFRRLRHACSNSQLPADRYAIAIVQACSRTVAQDMREIRETEKAQTGPEFPASACDREDQAISAK